MEKTKNADGSITYTKNGSRYTVTATQIAKLGEASIDKSMSYTPSAYSHPAEYAHLYDKHAGEED